MKCLLRGMKGLSASLKLESQLYQNTLLVKKASRIQKIPWQFCSFPLWRAHVKVEPGRRSQKEHHGPVLVDPACEEQEPLGRGDECGRR